MTTSISRTVPRRRRPWLLGAIAASLALGLASCDLLDDDGAADPGPSEDVEVVDEGPGGEPEPASDETEADPAEVEVTEADPRLAVPGVDDGIELFTPAEGEGPWPTLAWNPVSDAERYTVTVYAGSGAAYWTWRGDETEVILGGFDQQPREGSPAGPRIHEPMSWDVLAHDAGGRIVAQSRERPIAP